MQYDNNLDRSQARTEEDYDLLYDLMDAVDAHIRSHESLEILTRDSITWLTWDNYRSCWVQSFYFETFQEAQGLYEAITPLSEYLLSLLGSRVVIGIAVGTPHNIKTRLLRNYFQAKQ